MCLMWYYKSKGDEIGPVSEDQILELFKAGTLTNKTRVRSDDSSVTSTLEDSALAKRLGIAKVFRMDDDGNVMKIDPSKVKSLGWRSMALILSFGAYVFFAILTLIMNVSFAVTIANTGGLDGSNFNTPLGQFTIIYSSYAQGIMLICFLSSVISYCLYVHRSQRNVRLLGAEEATMSPFMTWIWHFIPIASLWKPLVGVSQIWNASHRLNDEQGGARSTLLGLWWGGWILGLLISRVASAMMRSSSQVLADLQPVLIVESISIVALILSATAFIMIARKVTVLHKDLAQHSTLDAFD